jgi:hypothetical protein
MAALKLNQSLATLESGPKWQLWLGKRGLILLVRALGYGESESKIL